MAANLLLFTMLSGLILLGIVAAILRFRGWRAPRRRPDRTTTASAAVAETLRTPAAWTAGFLVLVLVAVVGALAVVGGLPIPEGAESAVAAVLLLGAALVLGGFVFAGVYTSVRNRGHGSAPAVGLSALVLGIIAIIVVVVQLFLTG